MFLFSDSNMKTFVTTLAIVACVSTLLPFESANGENAGIAMISSGGSYLPGSVKLNLWFILEFIY